MSKNDQDKSRVEFDELFEASARQTPPRRKGHFAPRTLGFAVLAIMAGLVVTAGLLPAAAVGIAATGAARQRPNTAPARADEAVQF